MRSYGSSVINRMGDQQVSFLNSEFLYCIALILQISLLYSFNHLQVRWKRQVIEQRRNIYDRHSMLN